MRPDLSVTKDKVATIGIAETREVPGRGIRGINAARTGSIEGCARPDGIGRGARDPVPGEPGGIRTHDQGIKSPLLYH
jgi:hypothetical protein